MECFLDGMAHQHAVRRADVRACARRAPADQYADAQGVRAIRELRCEGGNMRDDPAQVADRNLLVDRLASGDELSRVLQAQRVILAAPPGPGNGAQPVEAAAGELADAAGPDPVVAEKRK